MQPLYEDLTAFSAILIVLVTIAWAWFGREKRIERSETIANPRAAVLTLMREMGLDYLGVNYRALPGDNSIVISRYACCGVPYPKTVVAGKPIPPEFVAAVKRFFPDRQVIVNERVITQADLDAERGLYSAEA